MQIRRLMRIDGFHMDLHTRLRFSSRIERAVSKEYRGVLCACLYDAIIVSLRAINLLVIIITARKRDARTSILLYLSTPFRFYCLDLIPLTAKLHVCFAFYRQ